METLLLSDAAYVQERFHAIETEKQRRHGPHASASAVACDDHVSRRGRVALDAVWPPTIVEKEVAVMGEILHELRVQLQQRLSDTHVESAASTVTPSVSPTRTSRQKGTPRANAKSDLTSTIVPERSASTQLALHLFFRMCASMRSTTANARLLAMVASKIPTMLAKLPSMPLSPGVVAPAATSPIGDDQCTVNEPRSVFEELLEVLEPLVEPLLCGSRRIANEKTTTRTTLSEAERANVLMAFVAVSLKWGRLRDLVLVLHLLIENPNTLASSHIELLGPVLSELMHAEAVVPARPLLPEASSATGYLVSFGKGDHGKLGHGQCSHPSCSEGNCTENKNVPTLIASTKDVKFVKIDSLSTHSIGITTKGEVMAWGNGDKYRLGHGTTTKEYAPRIIDSLSLKGKVVDVACGLGHTLALMENGDIYAWGNGSNGRLGLGDTNDRSNPSKLPIATEGGPRPVVAVGSAASSTGSAAIVFRNVVCGASHSLAVTLDGRVFAWGKNNQGQCGHGHTNDQLTAIEVLHFRDELNERVACAAGGWEHTLFCSTSGRVYSCGCGYKDSRRAGIPPVLGHGDCEKRLKPTAIQSFIDGNEEMVRVACGWDHSLAVSSQGALYTWGSGTNGKLGHGDEENCELPTLVPSLGGRVVKDAKAGCEHTVALTDNHELWTFGQGDSGRLGLGDTVTRKVPTIVDFVTYSGLQPVAIAVGDKYNLVLADDVGPVVQEEALKSPGKNSPPYPAKVRGSRVDHSTIARSCRAQSPPIKSLQTIQLKKLEQRLMPHEDSLADGEKISRPTLTLPRDQNELLMVIAMNVARLSTGYFTNIPSMWGSGGTAVEMLPYGVDTSPLTLDRTIAVIRACQQRVLQPSPIVSCDRELVMIVVCLRILTVNISRWATSESNVASLLRETGDLVNELASSGSGLSQQEMESDRSMELQSLIREEAAHILLIGFTSFYPSTGDRMQLLSALGLYDRSPSKRLSSWSLSLASKLCEDSIAYDIILQIFQPSVSHVCIPPHEEHGHAETDKETADGNGHNPTHELMSTLVSACAHAANQRLEMRDDHNEALHIQLQLLTVLQAHWFAVAECSVSEALDAGNADGNTRDRRICDCCSGGLSNFLCLVLTEASVTLKKLRGSMNESDKVAPGCLALSFIDSVVLNAVQAACVFLRSDSSDRAQEVRLAMAKALQPKVRCMVEVLDEITSKRVNSADGLNDGAEIQDARLKGDWVVKLGDACALLYGQIMIGLNCLGDVQLNNQLSRHGGSDTLVLPHELHSTADDKARQGTASYFHDGVRGSADLLRQLRSPRMKSLVLRKLSEALKKTATDPHPQFFHADITQPMELCGQLTKIVAADHLPAQARATALTIWLWVLKDAPLTALNLSEIINESGIVLVVGEILLRDTVDIGDDCNPRHRSVHQATGPQRLQVSSRLRAVEDLIGVLQPREAIFLAAYEVFSAAAKHLCSTYPRPPSHNHPLLTPIQTEVCQLTQASPSSSPRRCETLLAKPLVLSTGDTIKAVFNFTVCLLQSFVESYDRRQQAISPFMWAREVKDTDKVVRSPTTAFLLASPLNVSASRSHVVKPVRLPRLKSSSTARKFVPIVAMTLWVYVEAPVPTAGMSPSIVVLAALGETTDRLQESGTAAGSSAGVDLGINDGLRMIVFLFTNQRTLCLGCGVASVSSSSPSRTWTTMVVEEPIQSSKWIHVSVSCATSDLPLEVCVNGKRATCRSVRGDSSPRKDATPTFGNATSRTQLVVGGALDDALKDALGVFSLMQETTTSLSQPSHPIVEVLVDDVWGFSDLVDEAVATRLFRQGQTIVQLKREHDTDQKTLTILHLLNQTLALLPVTEERVAMAATAGSSENKAVAAHLQDVLFRLGRVYQTPSSFEIALTAVETMKHIVPLASTPSRAVLDGLVAFIANTTSTAFDLRDEVSTLLDFSTRAGVQSAAVAAAHTTLSGLLRQAGLLNSTTTVAENLESGMINHHSVLACSVIELIQNLSSVPAWQPHCKQLLDEAAAQLSNRSRPAIDVNLMTTKTIATVTLVGGHSECFLNPQLMALKVAGSAIHGTRLEAPWTSAHRSKLVVSSELYVRAAWQFGCDFHSNNWNLSERGRPMDASQSLLTIDRMVMDRVRLQTLVLRSLVGPLRASTLSTVSSEWRERILSDPNAMEALFRAAQVRTRSLIKARLGPDGPAANKLVSVQLLKDMIAHARQRSRGHARLFIEEDLEVLAWQLHAKLKLQERENVYDASSILCQYFWREPKVAYTALESLSGDVEIRGLMVRAIQHFPTVRLGRVAITASSGLWYYEVRIISDGLMQIGYVDTEFVSDAVQGQGVGDHSNSWAFDGYRRKKWNVSSADYGETWQTGDVVGVLLDTDRAELSYFLNGTFLGVAFTNLPLSPTSLLFPAISLNADQHVEFDFGGERLSTNPPEGSETESVKMFNLPALSSPLDAQRLRPVALAMEERVATEGDTDSEQISLSDDDSDLAHGPTDDDSASSPLATPTTPPPTSSFKLTSDTKTDDDLLFLPHQLPGSLQDNETGALLSGTLVNRIHATFGMPNRDSTRDDADDGDHDDTVASGTDATRKAELVHGLIALGFPHTWALRCAEETAFTLNDSGAVSWILAQMEQEAALSMQEIHDRQGIPHEGISAADEELKSEDTATSSGVLRAHDDLSLLTGHEGAPGRRPWQLALSPSRDGRPHSEQFLRSRVPLSSPQKRTESKSDPPATKGSLEANPFLSGEVASEDDEDNCTQESSTHASDATACQQFYVNARGASLRQQFARLDLATNLDATTRKDDETPRRLPKRSDRDHEDLLPACLIAHSVLSLAYVRLLVATLLFDGQSSATEVYAVVARWVGTEPLGLFVFLRRQLQLDAKELPVSAGRVDAWSDEQRIQTVFTRLLQYELLHAHSIGVAALPLTQAVVAEIHMQVAAALRRLKRVHRSEIDIEKVLTHAMNARWTLWLVTTLRTALLDWTDSDIIPVPAVVRRSAIQTLLEPAFTVDLTKLAALTATPNSAAWRNAAFVILQHLMLVDAATPTSPAPATLVPIQYLVELLAKLLRNDQSRRVAFGQPVATVWEMVLTHTLLPEAIEPEIPVSSASNGLSLQVEQVAATHVTISWECQQQTEPSPPKDDDSPPSEIASFDSSVLSLSVVAITSEHVVAAAAHGSPQKSTATLANGVPHFLPSKGSLVVRQLAPDTIYNIRISKTSSSSEVATETDSQSDDRRTSQSTAVHYEVRVRTPPEPLFELDTDAAGPNLVLSNRNRTVKNLVNKKWHTVRASVGFEDGVHHWHVRIDACVSKNIFIGVCTADASLENYVGSDGYGYGFLANKAVWHNKSKIHTYGEIFKQGDLLQVTLDCNARTLSYSRNGESLGIAASHLHVANGSGSNDTSGRGCKWYPAFSLYNKDDQLTLLVPPSLRTPGVGGPSRPPSQHASVLALVASARRILQHTEVLCLAKHTEPSTAVQRNDDAVWHKWKRGDVCWREVALGHVIEIDARPHAVAETFGLAPGDSIFTSRGHCVVLGAHNHELWYELVDALEGTTSGKCSNLGSWSLSACRDIVSSPDEYPVHRVRRPSSRSHQTEATNDLDRDTERPGEQTQTALLDPMLMLLVDAIVAHRGLGSAHQLSFTDLSSALVLHDVAETLRAASLFVSSDAPLDQQREVLLVRLAHLFDLNQHAARVVRLVLTPGTTASQWEQSACAAADAVAARQRSGSDSDRSDKERIDRIVAAGRLAANVNVSRDAVTVRLDDARVVDVPRHTLQTWLRVHLFETQREQLMAEALRRTATPTTVGAATDAKAGELTGTNGDDALLGEPKDMLRLELRRPSDGPPVPFWHSPLMSAVHSDPCWLLPPKAQRAHALFAQVSAQLASVDPAHCRRQFVHPADSLAIYRTVQLAFSTSSSAVDTTASDPVVLADSTSPYLAFWDELFEEIQSPRFPLFVPIDDHTGAGTTTTTEKSRLLMDVNAYLLLPEYAVRCDVETHEALAWFFQLGQLLGIIWRAKTIVPLQFVSRAFWQHVLEEPEDNDATKAGTTSFDERLRQARSLALRSIREGLGSIVPIECLQLSSPQSLRGRLADTDVLVLERLQRQAVYDPTAAHHEALWATLRSFSSLERHAFVRFVTGKPTGTGSSSVLRLGEDPIEQWKRQVITTAVGDVTYDVAPVPFRLELVDALADAQDHPDACFPVVHVVDATCSRLHLPAYSTATALRQKLALAISSALSSA